MPPHRTNRKSFADRIFRLGETHLADRHERPRLRIEQLESREMLNGDMAEIVGVVTADLQGDGNASNDIVLPGATAALYRDNGDGELKSPFSSANNRRGLDSQHGNSP